MPSTKSQDKILLQYDPKKLSEQFSQLTVDEKVLLTGGDGFATTVAIPRLGIRSLSMVEGVNGVKDAMQIDSGDAITDVLAGNGPTTFCFPSTNCFGATWNSDLMYELGLAIASQAKEKNVQLIAGPGLNLHRDPRSGRNFEYFSEDPHLSGRLAAAITNGIQREGIGAIPKHVLANDGENHRRAYDVVDSLDSRAIRELPMAAFQELLRTSNPVLLMMAYNKVEGQYCSESRMIKDIMRKEWGYDGAIMSDWFGTVSTVDAVKAGLDLEMPGPPIFRGQRLIDAVRTGLITGHELDERAFKMLEVVHKTGNLSSSPPWPKVKNIAVARQVASEGIVLLKNEKQILPLDLEQPVSIAVVGLHAIEPPMNGGGSSFAPPQYLQKPLDCIRALHRHPNVVKFAGGVKCNRVLPMIPSEVTFAKNGKNGVDIAYYNNGTSEPVLEEFHKTAQIAMLGFLKPGLNSSGFHYVMTTTVRPKTDGRHTIGIQATGAHQMFIDGIEVSSVPSITCSAEDYLFTPFKVEYSCKVDMKADRSYAVKIIVQSWKSTQVTDEPSPNLARLCLEEAYSVDAAIYNAVSVAKDSDVSIIFAGRNHEWESEGFDQDAIFLPGSQAKMVKSVVASSKRSVLVLYSGGPIDVSEYIDDVDALIHASYLGQEGGAAIADIISGAVCPSGRTPTTWPKRLDDIATFRNFPATKKGDAIDVHLVEGVSVGYRRAWSVAPRYPFGFGLSYTSFEYSSLSATPHHISSETTEIIVQVDVKNTGAVSGKEVVQVYVSDEDCSVWRPAKELKGFAKVMINSGDSQTVRVMLNTRSALSFWDEKSLSWRAEVGQFRVSVGDQSCIISLAESFSWNGL